MFRVNSWIYSFNNGFFRNLLEDSIKTSGSYLTLRNLIFNFYPLVIKVKKPSLQMLRFYRWIKTSGNEKLVDYPLNKNSILFDVGGYLGHFSQRMVSKYDPYIHIFEPSNKYYEILKVRFNNNSKVKLYNFGLGDRTRKVFLSESGSGSSILKTSSGDGKALIKDILEFIKESKVDLIDHITINIEGAEYELFPRMIKTGIIKHVRFLQVQFHDFVPDSRKKRLRIITKLKKTHKVRNSYPFLWESFELKK